MRGDNFVWTDLEEGILIDAVREADNVKRGLQNAAEVLGTTFYICRNRWYKHTQYKLTEWEAQEEQEEQQLEIVTTEPTVNTSDDAVQGMKESLEDFLGNLTKLVAENRRLMQENAELKRENRLLAQENKETKEAYDYILKVIDRVRKLCLADESRPERIKYTINSDGTIQTA